MKSCTKAVRAATVKERVGVKPHLLAHARGPIACDKPAIMPCDAILIVGPTGAGKSPLGDWLQREGLFGRRCHHFDFGANLRAAAAGAATGFDEAEIEFIRGVVERGALLENESFGLAVRILKQFAARRAVRSEDLLVMNGLPRHIGQAQALSQLLRFRAIVELQCSPETISARLQLNAGGDRTGRTDDNLGLVQKKLALFGQRTRPLLAYYSERGVPVMPVAVTTGTTPQEIVPNLKALAALP
jgi:adenylate kinase